MRKENTLEKNVKIELTEIGRLQLKLRTLKDEYFKKEYPNHVEYSKKINESIPEILTLLR